MEQKIGMLNRLNLKGYKSINFLDLELAPINILIGANGSGKSNFINFFKLLKKIIDKDLPLYTAQEGGANRILHFGKKITPVISFGLLFGKNIYNVILSPTIDDKFTFVYEKAYYRNSKKELLSIESKSDLGKGLNAGSYNSVLPSQSDDTIGGYIVKHIKKWRIYHFHDTSFDAKVKQPCRVDDHRILSPDGSNIAAFLKNIKETNQRSYKQIVQTIQRVAPFFQDFILEPQGKNEDMIKLEWKHRGTDEYFDANDLSDGTLRFICLTTLLLQPNLPTMILLDEPELGFHPFALNILAGMFQKISKKTQIIASTQSVTFVDNFDVEDLVVVDRKDNQSIFKRLDKENYKDWLEDYSLGEIWQKNLIGGLPSYD
ncbi:MAG: ABC transport protein, ATP-binding subunit [uncultured Campylobacterales bacterium]|uniref:ABC transport protein, ATP-binding subunit n=1 Tax=uncultured Campylobacterales bacterium TaxID=352960 RepID=A0A6S6SGZ3_9BACT|nr:MAG: ABC transport protein, ATP-binding subunit [uncultured Campylobacterales bacterium]